ncbi:oligosaccharide flippase family protein [Empedobacter falsenii]|uniref:lipopolysaccharide biosynthesis protein n=1 Tax=Empedobacter falsenii TaxID=343874 RepID=UPI003A810FFE
MKLSKTLKHPLLKSSLIYTVCDAINKAVPFLILPLLSYYLSPGDYGIIANFNVMLSIATIFIMIGVDGAIGVSYYKLNKQEMSKYVFNGLSLIFGITIIILFVIILFHDVVNNYIKVPFKYQLWLVLMAFFACITSINLSLWRLEEKAVNYGIYEILQTILNIGLSVYLVMYLLNGWEGRVAAMIVASSIFGVFSLFILFKRGYFRLDTNTKYLKEIIFFGLPIIPHALSFWIRSGVDRIYITNFVGEEATGLYATGFQFGVLISFVTYSFNNAFAPYIYKKLSVNDEIELYNNKKHLVKISYLVMFVLIVASVMFTIFSNYFLELFFSDKYIESKDFIFWAILAQTFQGFYLLFVNYIFFVKKTKLLAVITFTCSFMQAVLSYFLVKSNGAIGAAYATVIISFINFILIAFYSNIVCKMPWFYFKKH